MKGGAVGTDAFNYRDEVPVSVINLGNGLLITVDEDLDLVADAELDAL